MLGHLTKAYARSGKRSGVRSSPKESNIVPICAEAGICFPIFAMRVYPKQRVDPVLVTPEVAAQLLSVDSKTIDRLIQQGDLPTKPVGADLLIPYRSLLVFAGVARWRFQEIIES